MEVLAAHFVDLVHNYLSFLHFQYDVLLYGHARHHVARDVLEWDKIDRGWRLPNLYNR